MTEVFIKTDRFKEGIEGEEPDEWSDDNRSMITSIVSSIMENKDRIKETKEFKTFWKLYKEQEPKVKSFNQDAIEVFEEIIGV